MTLTALARESGVPLRTLSAYENAHHTPPPATVARLAAALGVTPAFLAADDVDLLDPDVVSFRKLSRTTAGRRDAALAAGRIAIEVADWLEARLRLPAPDLPTLELHEPETAAEMTRQRWGLGERAVPNAVHLLEAHGVRVFSLADDCREVDAFSLIRDDRPFVFLNTDRTAERQRFDAAHELGHLLLHAGRERVHGRDREAEANRFAAAFLMPRRAVVAQGLREATVEQILVAKRRWTVSALAMTHRLHELRLLSDWNYRTACVELARDGYRTAEPGGTVPEVSQLLAKALAAVDPGELAGHLGLDRAELSRHLFGLLPVAVTGGGATTPRRGSLRIVP
jgi:Zn-dependent peptidase ImmA (M78 family)